MSLLSNSVGDAQTGLVGRISNFLGFGNSNTPTPNTTQSTQAPIIPPVTPITTPATTPIAPVTPTFAPTLSPIVKPKFTLDSSNITSNHLSGDNNYQSVLGYTQQNQLQAPIVNPYAEGLAQYQQQVSPFQQQQLQATQFSPDYINSLNQQLNTNQGFRAGINNIRSRPEALDFQQGQEASLTRDTALTQQANAENLAYQEALRQNNIQTAQTGIAQAQQNYQNQFGATQAGLNYGIQQGQLGISQQSANQGRYDYQQITDPNTGFPTIQIIDKQTGLPSGNINPASPQGQKLAQSGMLTGQTSGEQQSGSGIVGGYDISSYATDPNHENRVTGWYNAINNAVQSVGGITTSGVAQQLIDQLTQGSPITGEMVINSAKKFGVDPAMVISLMQQDSSMGTQGKAVKTFNPGNVGNTDSGATKNYGNWANGVDAVASWLSQHKSNGQQNQVGLAVDNTSILNNIKAQLPQPLRNGVRVTASGIPYIDKGEVNSAFPTDTIASKYGIKSFSTDDAKGIQSLDTIGQSLNQMLQLSTQLLNPANGGFGTARNAIKNWYGEKTGTDPLVSDFNIYKDSAIKAVTALAGGTGSGLRLNTSTIMTAVNNLPTPSDSLETAIEKINKTRDLLNIQLGTAFSNPALGNGLIKNGGHSYNSGDLVYANGKLGVVNPDGTITLQ